MTNATYEMDFEKICNEHRAQFIREICEIMKMSPSEDYFERPLHITVSRANYDRPSIVVIELEGSPPRLPIVCDVNCEHFFPLLVNGKVLRVDSKKHKSAAGCMRRLLEAEGIDDGARPTVKG